MLPRLHLPVTLACGSDDVTIWLAPATAPVREHPIKLVENAWLLFDGHALKGLRLVGLGALCPYELHKVIRANAGSVVQAYLPATYDGSVNMSYIYLDDPVPGSAGYTIPDLGGVNVDRGYDGAILGLELFSPSRLLPELVEVAPLPARLSFGILTSPAALFRYLYKWINRHCRPADKPS